MTEGK